MNRFNIDIQKFFHTLLFVVKSLMGFDAKSLIIRLLELFKAKMNL